MPTYITSCDEFNNLTHEIWNFKIIKSDYTCYQLDHLIKTLSTKYNYPFIKHNGTGGIEFYKKDNFNKLCDFFDKLNIEYELKKINVNKLRENVKTIKRNEIKENEYIDYLNDEHKQLITKDEFNNIITKLNIKFTFLNIFCNTHLIKQNFKKILIQFLKKTYELKLYKNNEHKIKLLNKFCETHIIKYKILIQSLKKTFELKPYQIEARICFNNHKERFQHLIVAPTGVGKTVIFSVFICDHIIKHKKDIIILTKRKDILTNMKDRINNYIDLFVKNNITTKFDYSIIDCLNYCSTERLNKKTDKPRIFIINWDKFTSSNNTNHNNINWSKFGLIIVDESHWIGSPQIFNTMKHIKDHTTVDYIGLSATPIRISSTNQQNILNIFGSNSEYNILFEYSYYEALINKYICPIKYTIIDINENDLNNNSDLKSGMVLSEKSYNKIWLQIKTKIIDYIYFKKGIFWFKSRKDMLNFYNKMKNKVGDLKLIPTMSISNDDNDSMKKIIKDSELSNNDFDTGLTTFTNTNENVILLSVFRAVEGFDDQRIEFGIRMYYSNHIDVLNESQKMGRLNRLFLNNPNSVKKCGYYGTLEISDNTELIKKSLIQRFRSWITFAKTYATYKNGTKIKINKEDTENKTKELISMYFDIDKLKIYEIDLQKDILDKLNFKDFDKYKIRNALISENKNNTGDDIINVKSKYDEWAFENNFPTIDELDDLGFNDLKWLFNIKEDDYLSWIELKKVCKKYQNKYPDLDYVELYNKISKKYNIPFEPEEIYKSKFNNFNDLFN